MPPWPAPYTSAIALTLDNLGAAQEARLRSLPPDSPEVLNDPAITTTLPRILALLARHGVRATYFAESWSLPVYPTAVASLIEGGHEVAWHGYQHEVWSGLGEGEERENFKRSWEVVEGQDVVRGYQGFRPPGGEVNDRTWALMKEFEVGYVSPEGREFGVGKEGVVVLPFEWRAVDAFWYMKKFAGIRKTRGEQEEVAGTKEFGKWVMGRIKEVAAERGFMTVLFHPFLTDSEEKFALIEEVVRRIAEDEKIWVAPCREIAEWIKAHPEDFGSMG